MVTIIKYTAFHAINFLFFILTIRQLKIGYTYILISLFCSYSTNCMILTLSLNATIRCNLIKQIIINNRRKYICQNKNNFRPSSRLTLGSFSLQCISLLFKYLNIFFSLSVNNIACVLSILGKVMFADDR